MAARMYLARAAYMINLCSLCAHGADDVTVIQHVPNLGEAELNALPDEMGFQHAGSTTTAIIATKVNMYAMNHHVGQGKLVGYALKIYKAQEADNFHNIEADEAKTLIWGRRS